MIIALPILLSSSPKRKKQGGIALLFKLNLIFLKAILFWGIDTPQQGTG
jgi:hypothetical protein